MSDPSAWPRRTLARPAVVRGVTLFTAADAELTIRPATGGGISFVRADHPGSPIRATVDYALDEPRRTVLAARVAPPPASSAPVTVQTVEHVLSALAGFGITDAVLELAGPEVPIGDGSAQPFTDALAVAGTALVDGPPLDPIRPTEPILLEDAGTSVRITPREIPGCSFAYHLDYGPDASLPPQQASFELPVGGDGAGYAAAIAPARTFSTLPEVLAFRKMGLFTHLEPSQMLVFGPDGPIDNVLRFENEPARHKLLDLMGDLALAGRPIQADIVAIRSGHALNRRAAAAIAALP
jgi:UDP-3-O-acyl-N-acetylglucosamine deacetylase